MTEHKFTYLSDSFVLTWYNCDNCNLYKIVENLNNLIFIKYLIAKDGLFHQIDYIGCDHCLINNIIL